MTRKRFIKLMMSQGYDRNKAYALAECARKNNITYKNGYKALEEVKRISYDMIPKLAEIMQPVVETVQQIAKAVSAGIEAFGKAYHSAMSETE